jgi:hypothetical protein
VRIAAPATGLQLLAEDRRERVAAPEEPGPRRLAWSLSVAPRDAGGAWITSELRIDAVTGSPAPLGRDFAGPLSRAARRGVLRRLRRDLGAVAGDRRRPLAGDELLPAARVQLTHAIDIEAPPPAVWPWLVQMGRRRAGWYSWDRLDNGGKPSADRIIPELQALAVGDVVSWREAWPAEGFLVKRIEPERHLVLGSKADDYDDTWAFALEPIGDGATHLVTRYRAAYRLSPRMLAVRSIMAPLHAFMERKQLATLKQRAEGVSGTSPRGRPAPPARRPPGGSPDWRSAPRRTSPPRRGGAARPRAR